MDSITRKMASRVTVDSLMATPAGRFTCFGIVQRNSPMSRDELLALPTDEIDRLCRIVAADLVLQVHNRVPRRS